MKRTLSKLTLKLREEGVIALSLSIIGFIVRKTHGKSKSEQVRATIRHKIYKLTYNGALADPYRLIHVNPSDIDWVLIPNFRTNKSIYGTHIINGDWDSKQSDDSLVLAPSYDDGFDGQKLIQIENYGLFRSMQERYVEGKEWDETELYSWSKKTNISDETPTIYERLGTEENFERWAEQMDRLFHNIEEFGYKTQSELNGETFPYPEHEEVLINIGRDGDIILEDGRHRLFISKILGLESIPVRVLVRHKEWQKTRQQVSEGEFVGKSDHPDLVDVS